MTFQNEPSVAMAQWRCGPTDEDVARTVRSVRSFASRHGMRAATSGRTMRAVSEVLEYVATCPCATRVEAASDGDWLTVIVRGGCRPAGDGVVARAMATELADHVEWSARSDVAVVMEFRCGRGVQHRRPRTRAARVRPGRRRGCVS